MLYSGSGGEDLLALLAQLTLRPDVPVERHRPDTELPAEFGHRCVTVGHRGLGQPHLGFRQRELPAALAQGTQAAVESGPVVAYAGGEVVVKVGRLDALGPQGVLLQVQRLGTIRFGNAGVSGRVGLASEFTSRGASTTDVMLLATGRRREWWYTILLGRPPNAVPSLATYRWEHYCPTFSAPQQHLRVWGTRWRGRREQLHQWTAVEQVELENS